MNSPRNKENIKELMERDVHVQMIIAGMAGLIDDGRTFHEVMRLMEDIKIEVYPALMQIARGEG